jgi:HbrB-like
VRRNSPLGPPTHQRHKRQHSQGFFEPSLPSASISNNTSNMSNLTASAMAAQAAMQHHPQQAQHARKRSQTVPAPEQPQPPTGRRPPGTSQSAQGGQGSSQGQAPVYHNGLLGTHQMAAATAANAVFPRSQATSPGLHGTEYVTSLPDKSEKEPKQKSEKSKMKLFSKPKNIYISKDKDIEKAMQSPSKMGRLIGAGDRRPSFPALSSASQVSLADTLASSPTSTIHAASTTNLFANMPSEKEKEKEKSHKHYFLSRQKHKKDKDDHYNLPLSSASSNSKPVDPTAPQSIYSFAPASPSPAATSFTKSVSGLDLRHGGRALREQKKAEKAEKSGVKTPGPSNLGLEMTQTNDSYATSEWPGPSSLGSTAANSFLGPPTTGTSSSLLNTDVVGLGQGFGLSGMTSEDAWEVIKAKVLVLFQGDELRLPVEDFNMVVGVHIQRCIQLRAPTLLMDDFRDLLFTGFSSLDATLRGISDQNLIQQLVDMWQSVFGTILPYLQAVFVPLQLEFRGAGLMSGREARDFWRSLPDGEGDIDEELDVRRIVLISFRDTVILPRHDTLNNIFSRLSLESINGNTADMLARSPDSFSGGRPGTAMSLDPGFNSYDSAGSNLLNDTTTPFSISSRSRATSNTSAWSGSENPAPVLPPGGFSAYAPNSGASHANLLPVQPSFAVPDSAMITEIVGRVLQCLSVLSSVQTGDEAQKKMEGLRRTLRYNWLGRGRTGRNRRGFVGARMPRGIDATLGIDDGKSGLGLVSAQ